MGNKVFILMLDNDLNEYTLSGIFETGELARQNVPFPWNQDREGKSWYVAAWPLNKVNIGIG